MKCWIIGEVSDLQLLILLLIVILIFSAVAGIRIAIKIMIKNEKGVGGEELSLLSQGFGGCIIGSRAEASANNQKNNAELPL